MAAPYVPIHPKSATPAERLMLEVVDPLADLAPAFDDIRAAAEVPPPQFLPFLVWELGLAELRPYLPNLYDLIAEGVKWQRVRGTPAAIARGLGWLGYGASLEEVPHWRRRWNRFQLELDRVRDADLPDLIRIDGIARLSVPLRSRFRRGYRGYDIRAAETSRHRTSGSMTSTDSGVRVDGAAALWSFGRLYEREAFLSQADLTDLGTWIEPVPESGLWIDANFRWADAHFPWAVPAAQSRRNTIAAAITALSAWVRFRDADGGIIGHARAVAHPVAERIDGEYPFGQGRLGLSSSPRAVLVQATSGFGDGAPAVAETTSIVFGATLADPTRPGALWLGPAGLVGGHEVASAATQIPFGLTVRERTRYVLRF